MALAPHAAAPDAEPRQHVPEQDVEGQAVLPEGIPDAVAPALLPQDIRMLSMAIDHAMAGGAAVADGEARRRRSMWQDTGADCPVLLPRLMAGDPFGVASEALAMDDATRDEIARTQGRPGRMMVYAPGIRGQAGDVTAIVEWLRREGEPLAGRVRHDMRAPLLFDGTLARHLVLGSTEEFIPRTESVLIEAWRAAGFNFLIAQNEASIALFATAHVPDPEALAQHELRTRMIAEHEARLLAEEEERERQAAMAAMAAEEAEAREAGPDQPDEGQPAGNQPNGDAPEDEVNEDAPRKPARRRVADDLADAGFRMTVHFGAPIYSRRIDGGEAVIAGSSGKRIDTSSPVTAIVSFDDGRLFQHTARKAREGWDWLADHMEPADPAPAP